MAKAWIIQVEGNNFLSGFGIKHKPTKSQPHKREITIDLTQRCEPPYNKDLGFPPIFFHDKRMAESVCSIIDYLTTSSPKIVESEQNDD